MINIFSMQHCRTCLGISVAIVLCSPVFAQQHPIPRDTTYNVNRVSRQIARTFPMAVVAIDSMTSGLAAERDIVYATLENTPYGRRELHLDVFRPATKKKYPGVFMIHGGVPVEYQLSLEATYPAAVHNIKAAIRFVKSNAERFSIDTSKLAMSGCSAGGHLAALAGLTNGVALFEGSQGVTEGSSTVHAVIDIDGALDFLAPASLNLKRQPDSPDVSWLGGTFEQKPLIWKEASPIFWAGESTAVPMLFINSAFSRFHAGQDELIGMMKEWGVYSEVYKFDIKLHPFWLFHPWVDHTVEYMSSFLRKVFR
jgi:acetyl esterase/lipase